MCGANGAMTFSQQDHSISAIGTEHQTPRFGYGKQPDRNLVRIEEKDKLAKKVKQLVPALQIFNAKPMEGSNKSKKFLGENTLSKIDPPLHNASYVKVNKEVKRKMSKKDVKTSERNISERSSEKVHVIPSSSNDEIEMKTKRKKSQKDVPEKNIPNQKKDDVTDVTNLRAAKKAKSSEVENEEFPWFTDIH